MKKLTPGTCIDGFEVGDCIHAGGMAHIYTVQHAPTHDGNRREPGFPMAMKIPRMTAGDGSENIVSFEVEQMILPALSGPHVPRFVAAGDLDRLPYLVMEYIEGKVLEDWLDNTAPLKPETIAQLGAAVARAAHSLHKQDVCHLDIKPANIMIRPDGNAVFLDFGLSCHAHFPDLLAEEMRVAVGSPIWIAPEQVVGVRGDPRSDIFAIGVVLYQLATGETPFGEPATNAGLRQRLWMDPVPPRKRRPDLPAWLQEIILRCLAPEAEQRYGSAALLAFDLSNPDQVAITARGKQVKGTGFRTHFKRWIKAAGKHYQPSPLPSRTVDEAPIVMVALPHHDVIDATLYTLRESAARSLGVRPGARLACVTVIPPVSTGTTDTANSETTLHRQHITRMKEWARPLDMNNHQASFHVLEASDVAAALLDYARSNDVNAIILGAATHGLQMQRWVATVPIKVAMGAPCTVILAKQSLPFVALAQ